MSEVLISSIIVFHKVCHKFYHWAFASQYLRASILLPRFIKKRVVLLKMYDEKNEHEHAIFSLSEVYMDRHDMFDSVISDEKLRIK